ncbi:MAG: DNA-processing protein DprA [Bernardetiaceae bacterium]
MISSEETRRYSIALSLIEGIGGKSAKKLVSHCGSAEAVFTLPAGKLQRIQGISPRMAALIQQEKAAALQKADQEIERAQQQRIQILHYTDTDYPERLKHCFDAPAVLFWKGDAKLNNPKNISIVGTRQATAYGKGFLRELITALVHHKPLIVSGLAYGIDIEAHRLALDHDLETVGVMASGMDIIYPATHQATAQRMILEHGGLLTEQLLGTPPDARRFPARNRIIAGMTDMTLVVEAANKGGALITAQIANSYDRHVGAVPGNIHNTYSKGCNQLIKTHQAHIITEPADIERLLNWDVQHASPTTATQMPPPLLEPDEQKIYSVLQSVESMEIDELAFRTQLPINQLAALLLDLEFRACVRSMPGKRYQWIR